MELEKRPFTDLAKPAMFPFIVTPYPERKWDTDSSGRQFGKVLNDKIDLKNASESELISFFSAAATIQMASLQKGFDHMSLYSLALLEFTGDKSNQERIREEDHVDYRRLLQTPIKQLSQSDVRPTKQDEDAELEDTENPWDGYSYVHNINLYHGASDYNPFKEQSEEHAAFEKNKLFSILTDQFMSPLQKLGQKFWKESSSVLERLQKRSPVLKNVIDPYHENHKKGITQVDIHANYRDIVSDPSLWSGLKNEEFFGFIMRRWQDVKNVTKTIRTFAGRSFEQDHDVRLEERKKALLSEDPTVFSDYVSDIQNSIDALRSINSDESTNDSVAAEQSAGVREDLDELLGLFSETDRLSDELSALLSDGETQANVFSNPTQAPSAAELARQKAISVSAAEKWFNETGNYLPFVGMYLPFGAMAQAAPDMFAEMDWGNWGNSLDSEVASVLSDESGGFMDRSISGYFQHLQDNFLDGFTPSNTVNADQFAIDNIPYGNQIFQTLVQNGIIDQSGSISQAFDPSSTDFRLTGDAAEDRRIRGILRNAVLGPFNLEAQDNTKINDIKREQLKITTPAGDSTDIQDIIELIGHGDTASEKYGNSRDAYNILFDMYESMTHNHLTNGPTTGQPIITKKDDHFEMTVYPKGSWREWNPKQSVSIDDNGRETYVGGWDTVTNKPINIQFKTEDEAKAYFKKVEELILLLEPIIGTFEPTTSAGPGRYGLSYQNGEPTEIGVRVLTDNQGEIGREGIITADSSEYAIQIDTVTHASFFKTDHWQTVGKYIHQNTVERVGKRMFERSMMTRINKLRHTRRKENYKEKKEEHDENEYWRLRDEFKRLAKDKAEQKNRDKEYEHKVQKRIQEAKAAEKRSQERLKKLIESAKKSKAAAAQNKKK